jgi:NIMA (never in mitosis gene a)-related kinase
LSRLQHPCIISYKNYFKDFGEGVSRTGERKTNLYIFMEYADGGDLAGRIRKQGVKSFSEPQVISWLVQMCLALKHMHDRKVIHRDIKSENIFLTSGNLVKVGDFGISKSLASTLANAVTRIGTPYYLSPEICMDKPYNTKTDMWALGVVLYEMMSLKHPFDATSMDALLTKICRTHPTPLPKRWNANLRSICDQLLKKNPAERPTVSQLLEHKFLQQHVVEFVNSQPEDVQKSLFESYSFSKHGGGLQLRPSSNPLKQRDESPSKQPLKSRRHSVANMMDGELASGHVAHDDILSRVPRVTGIARVQDSRPANQMPEEAGTDFKIQLQSHNKERDERQAKIEDLRAKYFQEKRAGGGAAGAAAPAPDWRPPRSHIANAGANILASKRNNGPPPAAKRPPHPPPYPGAHAHFRY